MLLIPAFGVGTYRIVYESADGLLKLLLFRREIEIHRMRLVHLARR